MASIDERIVRLEQRKDKLESTLLRLRARKTDFDRKQDNRRKILVGAWLLREADRDSGLRDRMVAGLDKYLEQNRDRELFGLSARGIEPAAADAIV